MDPIHPIVPLTSNMPILPSLAPNAVKREQRRESFREGQDAPQPDEQSGDGFDDEFDEAAEDERDWDGAERRGGAADPSGSPRSDVVATPGGGYGTPPAGRGDHGDHGEDSDDGDDGGDDPRPGHIDISV